MVFNRFKRMKEYKQQYKNFREYVTIRNYAEYHMIKVENRTDSYDEMREMIVLIDPLVSGKFACDEKYFYFSNETDAMLMRLRA